MNTAARIHSRRANLIVAWGARISSARPCCSTPWARCSTSRTRRRDCAPRAARHRRGGRGPCDAGRDRALPGAAAPRARRGLARRAAGGVRRGHAPVAAARRRAAPRRRADGRPAGRAALRARSPTRLPRCRSCARRGGGWSWCPTGTCRSQERLEETGLLGLVDAAVASRRSGRPSRTASIFEHGLALAGVGAAGAWHVGDDLVADVEGARGAGIRPVLVDRNGRERAPADVPVLRDLDGLAWPAGPYA